MRNQSLWVPGGVWSQSWNLKELTEGHRQERSLRLNLRQMGKLARSRHSKNWQIDSFVLIQWVLVSKIMSNLFHHYVEKLFQNHDRSLPSSDVWPNLFEISSPNSSKIEPQISPKVRFLYFLVKLFHHYVEKLFQNHDRSLPNSDFWPNLFEIVCLWKVLAAAKLALCCAA